MDDVLNALASVVNEVVIGPWTTPEGLYSGSSERWVFTALNVALVTLTFAVIALIGWLIALYSPPLPPPLRRPRLRRLRLPSRSKPPSRPRRPPPSPRKRAS